MSKIIRPNILVLSLIMAFAGSGARAATYYVDAAAGNDNFTGLASLIGGQQPGGSVQGPWKTVSKVSAWLAANAQLGASINAGDTVLFKCGSIWDESLVVRRSGSSLSQTIVFGAYGDCTNKAKPTFRQSKPVTQWSTQDGTKWQAALNSDALQIIVYENSEGRVLPVSRYPKIAIGAWKANDPDMLRVKSALTCSSLSIPTSNGADASKTCGLNYSPSDLISLPSLVGADLVLREGAGTLDRKRVLSQDAVNGRLIWASTSANASSAPRLQSPAQYSLVPGYGFFASGLPWMITEPGEWALDRSAGQFSLNLYPYSGTMPPVDPAADGAVRVTPLPAVPGSGPVGIDALNQQYLTFGDLQVLDAAIGLEATGSTGVRADELIIARSAYLGVHADNSNGFELTNSTIRQTGFSGLTAVRSVNAFVSANQFVDIGTHVPQNGEATAVGINTWGTTNYYGIQMQWADNAVISLNRVTDSGYIGIRASAPLSPVSGHSTIVDGNTVENSCVYLDDCGAIYTDSRNGKPSQIFIQNNVVLTATGNPTGRPLDVNQKLSGSAANGIYLDDFEQAAGISGNVVTDTDQAVLAHLAHENSIQNNIFFASRNRDIWFQEELVGGQYDTSNGYPAGNICTDPQNCIKSNSVTSNLFVDLPKVPANYLESEIGDTTDFGTFDFNQYANVFSGFSSFDKWKQGSTASQVTYDWPAWQSVRQGDLHGSTLPTRLALQIGSAGEALNQTANGDFNSNTSSWAPWSPDNGHQFTWVADSAGGGHARLQASNTVAGSSAISLNGLHTAAGHTYVVRYAMRSDTPGLSVRSVLRNDQNYADVSPWLVVSPGTTWKTYYAILPASKTLDGVTFDPDSGKYPKARLDFEVASGKSIEVDDVYVAEITSTPVPARELLRLFAGGRIGADGTLGQTSFDCPDAGTPLSNRCSYYMDLRTSLMVTWPLELANNTPMASVATAILDPNFVDSDGDGVADVDDLCASTPVGASVDERGCTYEQRRTQ